MNAFTLRHLPFRLNFLSLKIFTILFLSFLSNFNGNISAYTTRVDTLTLDFNGQSKASFGTNDPYFTVKTRAYFCLETAYSAGQYRFVVRITDSKGGLVKEYVTARSNLPTAQSQVVEDTITNIPFSLLPGPGYYRISSTFEEFIQSAQLHYPVMEWPFLILRTADLKVAFLQRE